MSDEIHISIEPDEFKAMIREAVRDVLTEMFGQDASSEPTFSAEIAARLRRYQQRPPVGIPVDEVLKELNITDE